MVTHIVSLRKLEGSQDSLVKSRLLVRGIYQKICQMAEEEESCCVSGSRSSVGGGSSTAVAEQMEKLSSLLSEL